MDIEITEITNGHDITAVAKGHHSAEDFLSAYSAYTGLDEEGDVRHVYMRKTPRDGYDAWWTECEKGPGAFPATVMGPM